MRPSGLNSSWKTDDGWLHTDQNPATEKYFIRYQGILTFSESKEDSGGFICIPGFHKEWIRDFLQKTQSYTFSAEKNYCKTRGEDRDVCPFTTKKDPREEKIIARPGSLIIWVK